MRRAKLIRMTAIAVTIWLSALSETVLAQRQEWVEMMDNPNANFYEIQQNFKKYWEGRTVEKGQGWMPFKRWEYFMRSRVSPTGKLPHPGQAAKAFLDYLETHDVELAANWTPLGPTSWTTTSYQPGNGRINGIAFHPTNSNIIFVGSPSGGLWKTTNGGTSWTTTTDNLPVIGVTSIAIDPANPNIMYIATGDGDLGDTYSIGVLKSTDGGTTWNTTGLTWSTTSLISHLIRKLVIHPSNPNILLAATSDGVYKTSDAGATWVQTQAGSFRDLEFKPGDPATVYVCSNQFYKSLNTGDTFTLVTSGLPTLGSVNRLALGVSGANSSYVYALASSGANSGFYGLYRSVDGGASFTLQANTPNILGLAIDGSSTGGQGNYDLAIAVSPSNANVVYTGGINIWKSTNGGVNWTNKTNWMYSAGTTSYVHADIHTLDFNGATLYTGTDGGFFRSTNGATNWTDLSAGMSITQFYRIGGTPNSSNLVYGGAQDNGTNRYNNGAWTHVLGGDGMEAVIDYTTSNIVYASQQNGGLSKSTNGGASFSKITSGITETGGWVTPYVMNPVNPQVLYAGFINIWKTVNGGTSWTKISNFTDGAGYITTMAIAPSSANYIYAANDFTVYRTTDGGINWANITPGFSDYSSFTSIAVASYDPNKIWITVSDPYGPYRVFASTNGGTTWTNYSGTLPSLPMNCIVFANTGNDALYVGADIGVYYRDASLSDWQLYSTGLPNVLVNELEVHGSTGKLRAATYGRGLWETLLNHFNLSRGKPATASNSNLLNLPLFGNDGGVGTYWKSLSLGATAVAWWRVDLSGTYNINNVVIRWRNPNYAKQYTVDVSLNGSSWTTVYTDNAGNGSIDNVSFATVAARYVRVYMTQHNSSTEQIYEVEVYAGSSALAKATADNAEESDTIIPQEISLAPNYPNPFNPSTNLTFGLPQEAHAVLKIYNMIGAEVTTLVNERRRAGFHTVVFEAGNLSSGVYFSVLQVGDVRQVRRILLMK